MKYIDFSQDWPTPTPLPAPGEPLYEVDFSDTFEASEQAEQFVQAWNTYIDGEVWTLILIVLIVVIIIFGIRTVREHISRI